METPVRWGNSTGPSPWLPRVRNFSVEERATFMEEEWRKSKAGEKLFSRKDLFLPLKRALRSACGKKRKSYTRTKTKTTELRKAPNARQLSIDGSAKVVFSAAPENAELPRLLQRMNPLKNKGNQFSKRTNRTRMHAAKQKKNHRRGVISISPFNEARATNVSRGKHPI